MLPAHTHNFWQERTQVAVYLCHPFTMRPSPLVPLVPVMPEQEELYQVKSDFQKNQ